MHHQLQLPFGSGRQVQPRPSIEPLINVRACYKAQDRRGLTHGWPKPIGEGDLDRSLGAVGSLRIPGNAKLLGELCPRSGKVCAL